MKDWVAGLRSDKNQWLVLRELWVSFAISFFSKVRMRSKRSELEASKGEKCLFMWNDVLEKNSSNADSSEKISDLLSATQDLKKFIFLSSSCSFGTKLLFWFQKFLLLLKSLRNLSSKELICNYWEKFTVNFTPLDQLHPPEYFSYNLKIVFLTSIQGLKIHGFQRIKVCLSKCLWNCPEVLGRGSNLDEANRMKLPSANSKTFPSTPLVWIWNIKRQKIHPPSWVLQSLSVAPLYAIHSSSYQAMWLSILILEIDF